MTKRKKKPNKQTQTEVAEAATQHQQRLKLQRQIRTMKRLPKDFRDITLGTDWEAFASITGRRKEMDAWYHGPVLFLAPLNESEKMILGSPNELRRAEGYGTELAPWNWLELVKHAERTKCSWIYLPDEESVVIDALNVLFSRFSFNIRAKGQLISEHSGKPVGVVR